MPINYYRIRKQIFVSLNINQHFTAQQVESYLKLAHPHNCLCPLSAQSLTSCTPNPLQCGGTGGCAGSLVQLAFLHVNMRGIQRYVYSFAIIVTVLARGGRPSLISCILATITDKNYCKNYREKVYPYVSGDTSDSGECQMDYENLVASIRGYEVLPRNDMVPIMRHLSEVGA